MRVLLTSTPGTGHLHALAPLALALRSAGHDVLWATADESCNRVRGFGFHAVAAGMPARDRLASIQPHLPEIMALPPRARRGMYFARFFGWAAAPKTRVDLEPVFQSFRPDVVVSEMAELAAAPMAVARGLPHVTVAFSGALTTEAFPLMIDSITPVWEAEHVTVPHDGGLADDLYLHPFPPSFGQLPNSGRVRSMRADGFDGDPSAQTPEWINALGSERPLVYLTSGTEPAAVRAPWIEAFEALGSLDVDVVATIGRNVDPSTFGDLPSNVRVERFVPQRWLLGRASMVASHGGAGTLLAAAANGVPQVLNPIAADQWENADAVVAAGVGVVCEPDQRCAADLAGAFEIVLGNGDMRAVVARVADEIAAMPSPADHVAEIEALANR